VCAEAFFAAASSPCIFRNIRSNISAGIETVEASRNVEGGTGTYGGEDLNSGFSST
jgi:hypothetical protein